MNKELLKTLPTSWNELTLSQYNKLITANLIPSEENDDEVVNDFDINLMVIATLTDTHIDDLEALSFNEILPAIANISFLYTPLEPVKSNLKCKDISELSYADFVQYMQLQGDPFNNVNQILPIFFDELKDIDLNEKPISEIVFFLIVLQKKLLKHLKRSQAFLIKKILKQKVMNLFKRKEQA
ncbi:MAG: hypothetical protein EOO47_00060 [Flavobacterium sp.]|nr:MAG: hypothetical protein EOO47_00060 [Flavobacterium sp.]